MSDPAKARHTDPQQAKETSHSQANQSIIPAKKKPTGRPLKYKKLIIALDNDIAYSPATVFLNAIETGLFKGWKDEEEFNRLRVKVRHTLARLAKNHGFPKEGDQLVHMTGQAPAIGWFGHRWKEAVHIPLDEVLPEVVEDDPLPDDEQDDGFSDRDNRFIESFSD